MEKDISIKILQDEKIYNHFKEHSYFIKELNRDTKFYKTFIKEIKTIYHERSVDKVNDAISGVEMVSDIIDSVK